jgi:hypothetical protein
VVAYLLYFVFVFIFIFVDFVTRELKNTIKLFSKKSISAHHKKMGFFPPFFSPSLGCLVFCSICFLSRFWVFRQEGRKKIADFFSQPPNKAFTYLRHFFFNAPPLGRRREGIDLINKTQHAGIDATPVLRRPPGRGRLHRAYFL